MKLISRVTCPDGIDDCEYALINLTPDLARLGLKRIATLKGCKANDPELFQLHCWNFAAEYFNPWLAKDSREADRLAEMIETLPAASMDLLNAPSGFEVPENLVGRVECSQMVARDDAIGFIAIPKHTNVYVRTAEIPVSLLEEAAAERLPANPIVAHNA